jgi:hypothetical protein
LKNTLKIKHKGITKAAHHSILLSVGWVGLLKNTLRPNTRKESQRAASLNPCFQVGLGRTVEKYSKTKHEITKSSTSLNPCFIGGIG